MWIYKSIWIIKNKGFHIEPYRKILSIISLNVLFKSLLHQWDYLLWSEKAQDISLPLKELANILDLPHDGPRFKSDKPEECDKYMYKSATSSFLLNPKSCITSPFTIDSVRLDIRLIHYVANHILFPSRSNIGDDVVCNCRWEIFPKPTKGDKRDMKQQEYPQ